MTPEQQRDFAIEWAKWRDDPIRFNEICLKREPYWERQKEIFRSLVRFRATVVYSGNAVGKSFALAGAIFWWLYSRPGSLVICTAAARLDRQHRLEGTSPGARIELFAHAANEHGMKASPAVCEVSPGLDVSGL